VPVTVDVLVAGVVVEVLVAVPDLQRGAGSE
jgi:hypothetical protein